MLSQGKAIEGTDPLDTDLLSKYVKTHTPVTVTPGRLVLKNRKERARPERWPWTCPGPQGSGRFFISCPFCRIGREPLGGLGKERVHSHCPGLQQERSALKETAAKVGELIVVRQDRLRGMDFLQSFVFVGREFDNAPIPVRIAEGIRIADPGEKTGAIIHFPIPDAVKIACGQQAALSSPRARAELPSARMTSPPTIIQYEKLWRVNAP